MQKTFRGYRTRKIIKENAIDAQAAATDLTDQILGDSIHESGDLFREEAAKKIGSVFKGHTVRKKLP